jgi:hypothetical protein
MHIGYMQHESAKAIHVAGANYSRTIFRGVRTLANRWKALHEIRLI